MVTFGALKTVSVVRCHWIVEPTRCVQHTVAAPMKWIFLALSAGLLIFELFRMLGKSGVLKLNKTEICIDWPDRETCVVFAQYHYAQLIKFARTPPTLAIPLSCIWFFLSSF